MNISKFMIVFLSVVLLCSCTVSTPFQEENPESQDNLISDVGEDNKELQNDFSEDIRIEIFDITDTILAKRESTLSDYYAVINGEVKALKPSGDKIADDFNQRHTSMQSINDIALPIKKVYGGYVFFEESFGKGALQPLVDDDFNYTDDLAWYFIENLYQTVGVLRIKGNYIYTGDGKIYNLSAPETPRLLEEPRLNSDGTVTCSAFPETAEWQNVVDMSCAYWDYTELKAVFGLTSSGEVLSAGVDFTAENIVKLEVYSFDSDPVVPVALTADGRLIFPDYLLEESESVEIGVPLDPLQPVSDGLSMCDVAHASMEFTDVEDFVLTCVNGVDGYIMIVKKTDGSLHVTKNNYYDTEYLIEQ